MIKNGTQSIERLHFEFLFTIIRPLINHTFVVHITLTKKTMIIKLAFQQKIKDIKKLKIILTNNLVNNILVYKFLKKINKLNAMTETKIFV